MLADVEESQGNKEKAKGIYDALVESLDRGSTDTTSPFSGRVTDALSALVWITYMRFLRRAFSIKASREVNAVPFCRHFCSLSVVCVDVCRCDQVFQLSLASVHRSCHAGIAF